MADLILSWIFGLFFALFGVVSVFSEPIPGLVMLIMAGILLPPATKLVAQKWKFHLSSVMKILSIFVGLIILGATMSTPNVPTAKNIESLNENQLIPNNEPPAQDEQVTGEQKSTNELYKVISVTDGDTIKVDINGNTETLRLIGIDTPETVDPRKVVQCFGIEASNKAKEILTGKNVRLEADETQGERDKYNRLLRYVFLEDGTFYNKYMIEEGFAHEYTYQSNPYKYQADFQEAEKNAIEQSKGLWNSDTCNGDTTKSADSKEAVTTQDNTSTIQVQPDDTTTPANSSETTVNQENTSEPQVKKSTSNICHEKGISPYYSNTKHYTSYSNIEACLDSGGRLPKN